MQMSLKLFLCEKISRIKFQEDPNFIKKRSFRTFSKKKDHLEPLGKYHLETFIKKKRSFRTFSKKKDHLELLDNLEAIRTLRKKFRFHSKFRAVSKPKRDQQNQKRRGGTAFPAFESFAPPPPPPP